MLAGNRLFASHLLSNFVESLKVDFSQIRDLIDQAATWYLSGGCLINQAAAWFYFGGCLIDQAAAKFQSGGCLIIQAVPNFQIFRFLQLNL